MDIFRGQSGLGVNVHMSLDILGGLDGLVSQVGYVHIFVDILGA